MVYSAHGVGGRATINGKGGAGKGSTFKETQVMRSLASGRVPSLRPVPGRQI